MTRLSLTIGWLYPELMSTYGDRGNIIVLQKRALWRNIETNVIRIGVETKKEDIKRCNILFMGGAQDTQQEIVNEDLFTQKGEPLKEAIENRIPALFICGAYQFLGSYYKTADGTILKGLSIFDLYTENPGIKHKRLIGDIIIKPSLLELKNETMVGFENHGGRTYLGKKVKPFAHVLKGFGNNGKDKTEGMIYKNAIGTYLHGPILPKNPQLADLLLEKALTLKYKEEVTLDSLDDSLEEKARGVIIQRYR